MARIVEYSDDDEFPDLATLLRSKVRESKPETKTDEESDDEPRGNSTARGRRDGALLERGRGDTTGVEKSVKKTRRVLLPKADNPLLRRMGSTPGRVPETPKGQSRRERKVTGKEKYTYPNVDVEERKSGSGPEWSNESDGMSDFVVDDSESPEEEESEIEIPPPRSVRRLVQGRRPKKDLEDDLDDKLKKLDIKDGDRDESERSSGGESKLEAPRKHDLEVPRRKNNSGDSPRRAQKPKEAKDMIFKTVLNVEDPPIHGRSPSKDTPREDAFKTPPPSPRLRPNRLTSPKKIQRIPLTPHRPSMDNFWSQEVINDWNDEHSPRKTPKALPKTQPAQTNAQQDRIARDAKKAFFQRRDELAQNFLAELDETIADGQIAKLAEDTGGVKIIWSKRLKSTAGRAQWKGEKVNKYLPQPDGTVALQYRHYASIELAEKIIDDEDRLLNVIAHEFCHLACFMIDGLRTNPHGARFKAWGALCSKHFGDRGIKVTTKHSYLIQYKYTWECTNCGVEYKRHSKSINPLRHQCGTCKAKLVQTMPKPRAAATKGNEYQAFMKDNMQKVRDENPLISQGDIMGLIAKKYQESKAAVKESALEEGGNLESVSIEEEDSLDPDVSEIDGNDLVARELDFLNI